MDNPYAARALELVAKGFTPIPLTGKRPVTDGWQTFRALKPEKIYEWERGGLFKNIGMVCGAASNNVVVIDFDGMAGYMLFKEKFPELAKTFTVKTGSGKGMHVYFKVALLPDSKGYMGIPVEGGEPINIEIKSDGKQVVIPPSIHPDTGSAYEKFINAPIMPVEDITAVMNWAASLKPQEHEWQPPTSSSGGDNFNLKLTSAVESYFRSQPHKEKREWLNTPCPNAGAHKHGDEVWSFGYNTRKFFGHCYRCGDMLLKDLLPMIGIDPANYGGFYEVGESLKISQAQPGIRYAIRTENGQNQIVVGQALKVVTRSSRLSNYLDQLVDMESVTDNPPIPFPLRVLHEFGGMTQYIKPGKLIGLVGTSGGGKTSLLETMIDGWLCFNVPCLVWSPEWEADEFIERAVQRYGGPTMADVYAHQVYKQEVRQGILSGGAGVAITREKLAGATSALDILKGWTDEVGYIDEPMLSISQLQAQLEATLAALAFKPQVLAVDYAQLLHALEGDKNITMYTLLMRLKAICRQYGLVGLVASQVTKTSAKESAGGDLLDGLAARFVNDDAFNLFITINPDREMALVDMKHKPTGRFLPSAVLNITKSSVGIKGKVRVAVDWERLTFADEKHINQSFEKGEDYD